MTKRIPNHSILRLVGDGSTSPLVPVSQRIGVMPTVEQINTFGVPKDDLIVGDGPADKKFKALYPGFYTFTGTAELTENGARPMQLCMFNFSSNEDHVALCALGDAGLRSQAQLNPFTARLKEGDLVSFDVNNSGTEDVAVRPHSSGYSFEVRFQELPL